jgi:hypothetical protein
MRKITCINGPFMPILLLILLVSLVACKRDKKATVEQKKFANYFIQYEKNYLEAKQTSNDFKIIEVNNKMKEFLQSYEGRNVQKWIGKVNFVKTSNAFGSWVNVSYENIDFDLFTDMFATKNDTLNNKLKDCFSKLKEDDWVLFNGKLEIIKTSGGLYSGSLKEFVKKQTINVKATNVELLK